MPRDAFRRLWWGETVSLLGSQVTALAVPLTAIVALHASAFELGALAAGRWLPYILLSLPIGLLVDRHRRRPVLIAADLVQALALATVPLLALCHALTFGALLVATTVAGMGACAFEIAYRSYLPSLVSPERLTDANAKLSISESAAELAGPGIGGLLVHAFTGPVALLVDVGSFVVSALALHGIDRTEARPAPPGAPRSWRVDLHEGLALTWSSRLLRAFAGEAATYNFFWQGAQAVLILYAIRALDLTGAGYGVAVGVGSAGALLGAALTGRVAARAGVGPTIVVAAVVGDAVPFLLPGLAVGGTPGLLLLTAVLFVQGIGVTACNVHVNAIRQTIVPGHLLGRVNAAYRTVLTGVVPLGTLSAGALAETLGARATLLIYTAGLAGSAPWLIFSPARSLRSAGDASL